MEQALTHRLLHLAEIWGPEEQQRIREEVEKKMKLYKKYLWAKKKLGNEKIDWVID